MAESERVDALVLGSGQGGKLLAWRIWAAHRRRGAVLRLWLLSQHRLHAEQGSASRTLLSTQRRPALRPVGSRSTWRRFASANARWSSAKLRSTCQTTGTAAPRRCALARALAIARRFC
jgi:hypothetical protein